MNWPGQSVHAPGSMIGVVVGRAKGAVVATLEDCIPALRRYAWALLRDSGEADDLVQDTVLRALDRGGTREPGGDLRAWLFTIMHNLNISRWRRARVRAAVAVDNADADMATPAPQQASAEMRDVLRGIDLLPEEQRQILLLVAVEGMSYGDVAKILGLPIGTVMSRLSRARDRLSAFMSGQERPALRRVK
jgi:RNA polymerase sigma-70 factor (ECF subfamily)